MIEIPGLPEGVVALRWGLIENDGEYWLGSDGSIISNDPLFINNQAALVVRLSSGYIAKHVSGEPSYKHSITRIFEEPTQFQCDLWSADEVAAAQKFYEDLVSKRTK